MKDTVISDSVLYIGCDDKDIDLFESQYVVPNGISYNSYVILDDKICVMDTVDKRKTSEWMNNLKNVLGDKTPDYLVVSHVEPDHAGSIADFIKAYPECKIVGNAKTFTFIEKFFDNIIADDKKVVVKENDTLELGSHTLTFVMAPMVHWPEVMVSYESSEKILFSADAFGKFGALDTEEDWACEARRYYFNIVGKYGVQVQGLLKKAAALDIKTILPLHGPLLKENLEYYVNLYDIWSSYKAECEGVFIAFASIHGNTADAANKLKEMIEAKGVKVAISDLSRDDIAEAVEDAFKYDRMVLAASSYDGGVFPPMETFIHHLKAKNYQNRTIGIVENGSWAPSAARTIKAVAETYKNCTIAEPVVTINSALKPDSEEKLKELADVLTAK